MKKKSWYATTCNRNTVVLYIHQLLEKFSSLIQNQTALSPLPPKPMPPSYKHAKQPQLVCWQKHENMKCNAHFDISDYFCQCVHEGTSTCQPGLCVGPIWGLLYLQCQVDPDKVCCLIPQPQPGEVISQWEEGFPIFFPIKLLLVAEWKMVFSLGQILIIL